MTKKRRRRHTPEQIVSKLRDADAMLNAGKDLAVVLQTLEIAEATYHRWRHRHRRVALVRLKQIVAGKELDIQMLKHLAKGNCRA